MGKIKYAIACAGVSLLLGSCFSDDGNYNYETMQPPTWLINVKTTPISVSGRGGQDMTLDGSKVFTWGSKEDSIKRSQDVRYEWIINDKVVSTELKETLKTEELMERAGITDYTATGDYLSGKFSVIEKSTGVSYQARTTVFFYAPISSGDFVVYSAKSEKEANVGGLSVLTLGYKTGADGKSIADYTFTPNVSGDIPGTPKQMDISLAKNVSATGSVTAITQEGDASVYSGSTLKKVWDLKEQFAEGVPENFLVSARRDQEDGSGDKPAFTWVATKDGRVFTRQTGKRYLGGKFISEPYYIDEKGYKITKFGHTLWGITNIPCYDEKNRRVIIATSTEGTWGSFRTWMTPLSYPGWQGAPIMEMPEDAEVFYLTQTSGLVVTWPGWPAAPDAYNTWFQIYYNSEGSSQVGTFCINNTSRGLVVPKSYAEPYTITGHTFTKETVFLVAAQVRYSRSDKAVWDLFSEGDKVFAVIRSKNANANTVQIQQMPLQGIKSKITCMTYDRNYDDEYYHLLVGCENGDVLVYYVKTIQTPILMKTYNAGGRVASIKQLGRMRTTLDMY